MSEIKQEKKSPHRLKVFASVLNFVNQQSRGIAQQGSKTLILTCKTDVIDGVQ